MDWNKLANCLNIGLKITVSITQGYSSKDKKGTLFDGWDLSESGGSDQPEVGFFFGSLSLLLSPNNLIYNAAKYVKKICC